MKKIIKLSILLVCLIMISGCKKGYLNEISYSEYEKLIANKETFILEVMRTECTACISFKPKLKSVIDEYKIEVKYINTDHLSEKEFDQLEKEIGISGTPTVIFYKNGKEDTVSSRINGSVSTEKIISKFKVNGYIESEK